MANDRELLLRYAEQGDGGAFTALADEYAGMVYATCYRILRDAADAEDVAQECFLELARKALEAPERIGAWLHGVATRKALHAARTRTRRRRHEAEAAQSRAVASEEEQQDWAELGPIVDEAIETLPEELRSALIRHYLQRKTFSAIAEESGVSHQTISRRVNRAVGLLREMLKKRGVLVTAATLSGFFAAETASAAVPLAVTAGLGKIAASGVGVQATTAVATTAGGTAAAGAAATIGGIGMKAAVATFIGTSLIVGTLVVHNTLGQKQAPPPAPAPAAAAELSLRYNVVPDAEQPIAKGQRVIWLAGKDPSLTGLKAVLVTPKNRKAVLDAVVPPREVPEVLSDEDLARFREQMELIERATSQAARLEPLRKALAARPNHPDNIKLEYLLAHAIGGTVKNPELEKEKIAESHQIFRRILARYHHMDYYTKSGPESPRDPQVVMPYTALCLGNRSGDARYYFTALALLKQTHEKRKQDWLNEPEPTFDPNSFLEGGETHRGKQQARLERWQKRQKDAANGLVLTLIEQEPLKQSIQQYVERAGTEGKVAGVALREILRDFPAQEARAVLRKIVEESPDEPFSWFANQYLEATGSAEENALPSLEDAAKTLGLALPVEVSKVDIFKDGGTLLVEMTDANKKTHSIYLDGRMGKPLPRHIFTGAYPEKEGSVEQPIGGRVERAIYVLLKDWSEGQADADKRAALLDRKEREGIHGLEKEEITLARLLGMVQGLKERAPVAVSAPEASAFGPVIEYDVDVWNNISNCALDMDTGALFPRPKSVEDLPERSGWTRTPRDLKYQDWWRKKGVDLRVTRSVGEGLACSLEGLDTVVIRVDELLWNGNVEDVVNACMKATPYTADAVEAGHLGATVSPMLPMLPLPAYYAFRTREGGMGILQVAGLTDNPKGVKIRYKLVQSYKLAQIKEAALPGSKVTIAEAMQDDRFAFAVVCEAKEDAGLVDTEANLRRYTQKFTVNEFLVGTLPPAREVSGSTP